MSGEKGNCRARRVGARGGCRRQRLSCPRSFLWPSICLSISVALHPPLSVSRYRYSSPSLSLSLLTWPRRPHPDRAWTRPPWRRS
eukprot:scaffold13898_cov30-Tisochrysis_lutea.AAC.1